MGTKSDIWLLALVVLWAVVIIGFWGAVIYTASHFISKFW
jgi:hypothetical protein